MRLKMHERETVTKVMNREYHRATKKEKGAILDRYIEATGYNRVYAARRLRNHGKRVTVAPKIVLEGSVRSGIKSGPRQPTYGPDVLKALKRVWKYMDYICGKRLAAILPEVVPRLVRCGDLHASRTVQTKLMSLSAATIDRLLAEERTKHTLKGRSGTKPGTLLKHDIPVRTFADWDDTQPGFVEIDLVGHDGGSTAGEYCQTLDATDVATGWSEQLAVPTKAQCWVFEALKEMRNRLPFALRGIDSDNGSEFINHQLKEYCEEQDIAFTRSRACKKNDNCYVEQKNWSIVRRHAGYARYDSQAACQCLNDLYRVLHDYVNFFMPSMKLIEKIREGAKVRKRYDTPQTPYQRVLASPHVDKAVKRRLKAHYVTLNPAALHRQIVGLQKQLIKLTARAIPDGSKRPKPAHDHPWRRTLTLKKSG